MTDDQLFGEKDIEKENEILRDENKRLQGKVKRLNAFIVERGLAVEYVRWNKKGGQFEEDIYTPSKKPMRFIGGKP